MKCYKCGREMVKGMIIAWGPNLVGARVNFRREENLKKLSDPSQLNLKTTAEAWYCEDCGLVIGEFEEKQSIFD